MTDKLPVVPNTAKARAAARAQNAATHEVIARAAQRAGDASMAKLPVHRDAVLAEARTHLGAFLQAADQLGLTRAEIIQILAHEVSMLAQHAVRAERAAPTEP
jgi:hypothetical protein